MANKLVVTQLKHDRKKSNDFSRTNFHLDDRSILQWLPGMRVHQIVIKIALQFDITIVQERPRLRNFKPSKTRAEVYHNIEKFLEDDDKLFDPTFYRCLGSLLVWTLK